MILFGWRIGGTGLSQAKCLTIGMPAFAAASLAFWSSGVAAQSVPPPPVTPPTASYLRGDVLNYTVPPAPANISETGQIDLYLVGTARANAGSAALNEAYDDAANYPFQELLPRFSQAMGNRLSVSSRPILAHMLSWVLADTGYYAKLAKLGRDRDRPYVETAAITACYDFAPAPLIATESYPSGHATNGYAAGLLLASLFPDDERRRASVLARGVRYGDNRVICGVHHPIDVVQGRLIAKVVFGQIAVKPAFIDDLACAVEEDARERARDRKTPVPAFTPACAQREATYRAEIAAMEFKAACADWPAGAADKPKECPVPKRN